MWEELGRRLLVASRRHVEVQELSDSLLFYHTRRGRSSVPRKSWRTSLRAASVVVSGSTPPTLGSTRTVRHCSSFFLGPSVVAAAAAVVQTRAHTSSLYCFQTNLHSKLKDTIDVAASRNLQRYFSCTTKLPSSSLLSGVNTAELNNNCESSNYDFSQSSNTTTFTMDSMPAVSLSIPSLIGLKTSTPEDEEDSGKAQHLENTGIISSIVQATSDIHLPRGVSKSDTEKEKKWYIGSIDCGTTSSRFLIFDGSGNPTASHQIEFENIYPESG
jgi:hypothetical protein